MTEVLVINPPMRRRVLRRVLRNPLAVVGLGVVLVAVAAAVFAPLIAPFAYDAPDFTAPSPQAPSLAHWLGTDELGRDQLSRVLYGLRVSVIVGALAVVLSVLIGVPFGLLAGFYGWLDPIVSRFTDLLLAFPFLILAVGLAAILGPSLLTAVVAIGVAQIPGMIRVTRGETLRLRGLDYVGAAFANGAGDFTVLRRHILPNAVNAILVQATVYVPMAVIGEAVLSFLGLGVRPPTPSLGVMLANAQQFYHDGPWMAVFPGLVIVVLTLALNLLGDGLRDALDPKERR
ncbi:ABC transporter permease [Actinocrispum wychmicini]|uniref:Peptide/nickel transport system permease protein n=1 Tax=Actinocrispum wychmicini TaxID=1213861 RepID=A0A4R2JDD7_9PSEU|nr:ABC transporter permease [Actinocrispum wychmicini]TCO54846.1 peptide/nickel transport system permease protein [Actinocrispum wychmicini]